MTGYEGNPTPAATVQWASATNYPLSQLIEPATQNGMYFKATSISGTGTSGGSEPAWPNIVGATVTDNPGADQIIWTCMGSNVNFSAITVQEPADGVDDVAAATVDSAFGTLSDFVAFILANYLGIGQISNPTSDVAGLILTTRVPTARELLWQFQLSTNYKGRIYADGAVTVDALGAGITVTTNARWDGSVWHYDPGLGFKATRFIISGSGFYIQTYSGASGWIDSAWEELATFSQSSASDSTIASDLSVGGYFKSVGGVGTAGNVGVATIFGSSGNIPIIGFNTPTVIATYTPATNGFFRATAYATTSNSNTPTVNVQWTDPETGITYAGSPNMVSIGSDVWAYEISIFAKHGTSISISVIPNSQTCNGFGTIEQLN